jgi:hypothetical protein
MYSTVLQFAHTHAPLHACAGPPRAAPVCIMRIEKWRLDVDARAARLSPPPHPYTHLHTNAPALSTPMLELSTPSLKLLGAGCGSQSPPLSWIAGLQVCMVLHRPKLHNSRRPIFHSQFHGQPQLHGQPQP